MSSPATRTLLANLEQAFDARAWHGTPLARALRGVRAKQAAWRPGPGRNSIWDLVLHTAYWKYIVRCRLTGDPGGAFPRPGANFPAVPALADDRAFAKDVKLLRKQHNLLVATVSRFPAARLNRRGTRWSPMEEILGIAAHDLYHCGQIQLLKVLQG
ncbi:MAG: DinB family protein [Gemmatimonadetes bacterium]|nr:DinB family protein [Gemmatimonadota bacterium]